MGETRGTPSVAARISAIAVPLCLAALQAVAPPDARGQGSTYLFEDLGLDILTSIHENAVDVNNSGQVSSPAYEDHESPRSVRLNPSLTVTQDLGTLPGHPANTPHGINEAGQVVGESFPTTSSVLGRAYRFTDGVGMQALPLLPGGTHSIAYATAPALRRASTAAGWSWASRRPGFPARSSTP